MVTVASRTTDLCLVLFVPVWSLRLFAGACEPASADSPHPPTNTTNARTLMASCVMHWRERIISLPISSSPPRERFRIMTLGNLDQASSSQALAVALIYVEPWIVGNPEVIL